MYPKVIGQLSAYANSLPSESKKRYAQKILSIGYVDPYEAKLNSEDFPSTVTTGHIVDYLVTHVSPTSGESFRKTKSFQAYRKFEDGFVSTVQGAVINGLHVVRGKVSHSMKLNLPPLTAWVIVETNGAIQSAHCNCVAGLSESCSHISTLLFALANLHTMMSTYKLSVTELPCYWARPSKRIKEDLNHPVKDIDYGFKITRMDDFAVNSSREKFLKFLGDLKAVGPDAAVLKKFCDGQHTTCGSCMDNAIPDNFFQQKNVLLQNLFDPNLEGETLDNMRRVIPHISSTISIRDDEIDEVERLTRNQSNSDLWRWARTGRITASVMKECMQASTESVPSKMTLLRKICYPGSMTFNSEATLYGRRHEEIAKRAFKQKMEFHDSVVFHECGLYIYKKQPYIAATPDLIMVCKCHGKICVEIKCPFRLSGKTKFNQQLTISSLIGTSNAFLEGQDGNYVMVKKHPYYAQIQTQIQVTGSNYGLLFVWSKGDQLCLLIEKDPAFWEEACVRSKHYFENIILIEIVANHFSNQLNQVKL